MKRGRGDLRKRCQGKLSAAVPSAAGHGGALTVNMRNIVTSIIKGSKRSPPDSIVAIAQVAVTVVETVQ